MTKEETEDYAFVRDSRLTKSYLFSLEEGKILMSNTFRDRKPFFVEVVVSAPLRNQQWERIKTAGVNGRLCWVFNSKDDFEKWKHPNMKVNLA